MDTTPSQTLPSTPQYLEVNWDRVLTIWWEYAWRCVVFSVLIGLFLGFCGGMIVGVAGYPELGGAVGALLGWLGSIGVSIVVLRTILQKKFSQFSIKLVREL